MVNPTYYGEYRSSTVSQTGCIKQFVTSPNTHLLFPPQVSYECSLCNKTHGFRLVRTWSVSTEKQIKSFEKYCVDHKMDLDVPIK